MKTQYILDLAERGDYPAALRVIETLDAAESNKPVKSGNALILHLARIGNADLINALAARGCNLESRWKNPAVATVHDPAGAQPGALSQEEINAMLGDIAGPGPAASPKQEIVTQDDINSLIDAINTEPDRDDVFVNYTALDICQWEGFREATLALVNAGADCCRPNPHDYYPLGRAVLNEWYDVARAMLLNGADPDMLDTSGQTIWHMAAGIGHPELIKMALKSGCDPNRRRNDGVLPLHVAAASGTVPCIEALLAAGAGIFRRSKKFDTALAVAVMAGNDDALRILEKQAGLDEYTDSAGNTLLHYAAWNGHAKFCSYLLSRGQMVDALNRSFDTPLGHAALHGHAEVCTLLLKSGADPSHVRARGQSITDIARARGHMNIVRLLQEYIEKED